MKKSWLYNKTVVITGASGGLGFSIAKRLILEYNCKIIGIARNEAKILKSIESLGEKKYNFSYRLFDVSIKENWLSFYNYLVENNIEIDMLINNAGFMLPFSTFDKYTDKEIDEIIYTNFISNVIDFLHRTVRPTVFYSINIASPKEKNLYFSSTAVLYASIIPSRL